MAEERLGGMVGAEGFEPPTLCSQSRCATRLRYAPTAFIIALHASLAKEALKRRMITSRYIPGACMAFNNPLPIHSNNRNGSIANVSRSRVSTPIKSQSLAVLRTGPCRLFSSRW